MRLGEALVAKLDPDDSEDLLARWMAHHAAERLIVAKGAKGNARIAANDACRRAILDLWQHRAELPDGKRPLEVIEPAIKALRALDPDQPRSFYHREIWDSIDANCTGAPAAPLARAAKLDRAARMLLASVLRDAAGAAIDQTLPWVALAAKAKLSVGPDIVFVLDFGDGETEARRREAQIRPLRERIELAQLLADEAAAMAELLRDKLVRLTAPQASTQPPQV